MYTPFSFEKDSIVFAKTVLTYATDAHRQQLSKYMSTSNMQRLHHGRGWLTVREDSIEESNLEQVSVQLAFDFEAIRNNDISKLIEFISQFVEGFTSQMAKSIYKTINESCEKTGNVVDATNASSKAEAFLTMLQHIELAVDANGQVTMPDIHLHPSVAQGFIEELNAQGDEFEQKVEQIKSEKIEAALKSESERLSKYRGVS